jgi:hypothetical protein
MLNNNNNNNEPTPNKSYVSVWNRFKTFVEAGRASGTLGAGDKFLSRQNVDKYFEEVVAHLSIQPAGARRHVTALQWYSEHVEYPDDDTPFQVLSGNRRSVVQKALENQANKYAEEYMLSRHDAHANLPTDVLSGADHKKVMTYLLQSGINNLTASAFPISWTCCHSTFMRLDSALKMRLPDLRADSAHGPVKEGPNATILSWILQPGQHKDDHENATGQQQGANRRASRAPKRYSKRVLGQFRHLNLEQCGTGMVAASLFDRLYRDLSVSFIDPPGEENLPTWQKIKVLDGWSSPRSAYTAYQRILTECNVHYNKVTHLRSCGMSYASIEGLAADLLATMSKHRGERIFEAYMTELMPIVMKVMAGFGKAETYFVPRSELQLPFSDEEATRLCFPLITRWKEQQASADGDKDTSAVNFLYKLLPFLSRVILQDGPFWLRFYPNHRHSQLLRSRMPQVYLRWAEGAIQMANEIRDTRDIRHLDNMNDGVRNAFDNTVRSNHELRTEIQDLRTALDRHTEAMLSRFRQQSEENARVHQAHQQLQTNFLNLLQIQQNANQQQAQIPAGQQGALRGLRQVAQQQQQEQARQQRQEERRRLAAQNANLNDVLRGQPRIPDLPAGLPASMVVLQAQWQDIGLSNFQQAASRRHWSPAKKVMYSKWKYLFDRIKARADRTGTFQPNVTDPKDRLHHSAESYDQLRGDRTMGAFLQWLKQQDAATRRRQRGQQVQYEHV